MRFVSVAVFLPPFSFSYQVAVAASNTVGRGSPSAWSAVTNTSNATNATAPLRILIVEVTQSSYSLTWSAPLDSGGAPVSAYHLYGWRIGVHVGCDCSRAGVCVCVCVRETTLQGTNEAPRIDVVAPTARSASVLHILGGVTYSVTLRAVTGSAPEELLLGLPTAPVAIHTRSPTPPVAPANFSISNLTSSLVELSWSETVETGGQAVACYRVEYLLVGTVPNMCAVVNLTATEGVWGYADNVTDSGGATTSFFAALPLTTLNVTAQVAPPAAGTPTTFTSHGCFTDRRIQLVVASGDLRAYRVVTVSQPHALQVGGTEMTSNPTRTAVMMVPARPPNPPPRPVALVVTATTVSLGIDAPSFNGACPITTMALFWWARAGVGTNGNAGTGEWVVTQLWNETRDFSTLKGQNPLRYQSSDLIRATPYKYALTATNALGTSPTSALLDVTTAVAPSSPPLNLTVNASGYVTANLSWAAPFDTGGSAVVRYDVVVGHMHNGSAVPLQYWFTVTTDGPGTFVTIPETKGLMPDTSYACRVRAVTNAGTMAGYLSDTAYFTTKPPRPCPLNCSGHGTCHLWNGSCLCDTGYATPDCATIDGAAGVAYVAIVVDPDDRAGFVAQFSRDVAHFLNVSASRVHVLDLTAVLDPTKPASQEGRRLALGEDGAEKVGAKASASPAGSSGWPRYSPGVHQWIAHAPVPGTPAYRGMVLVEPDEPQAVRALHSALASSPPSPSSSPSPSLSSPPSPPPVSSSSSPWVLVPREDGFDAAAGASNVELPVARALLVANTHTRVYFVVLRDDTPGAPNATVLMDEFVTEAVQGSHEVAGLGISAVVQPGNGGNSTVVGVAAPACELLDTCDACLAEPGCGFCQQRGLCEVGSALGPAFGSPTCDGEWYHEDGAASTCLPHCSTLTGCDACMGRPDCTFCESNNTCAPRMPLAARGVCPNTQGVGWMTDFTSCPSQRCLRYNDCANCVLDSGCGYCSGANRCFAGNSFQPTGPAQNCLQADWRYANCFLKCPGEVFCGDCLASSYQGKCGWCPSLLRCGAAAPAAPGTLSQGPLSGSCPDFISNSSECLLHGATDAERCHAATGCGSCLTTKVTGAVNCSWCHSSFGQGVCRLDTQENRNLCVVENGDMPQTDYCVERCSSEHYAYVLRNGSGFVLGCVCLADAMIPMPTMCVAKLSLAKPRCVLPAMQTRANRLRFCGYRRLSERTHSRVVCGTPDV